MKRFELIIMFVIAGLFSWTNPLNLNPFLLPQKSEKKKEVKTDLLVTNESGSGPELSIHFIKGEMHNHPLMAIWVEDTSGNYIQTLFVANSIATGVFNYGDVSSGRWEKGEVRRPAALPYWAHKRGIRASDGYFMPTPENPVPDAYSGATPKNNFELHTRLDQKGLKIFNVMLEINQPWDWNEYWTNSKYPDNEEYKASAQPAVVYQVTIDLNSDTTQYVMELVGHSHYAGENGKLFTDLSSITTAQYIADSIQVIVK